MSKKYATDILQGIDIVDCLKIEQLLQKHEKRFLNRVFTPTEQRYCSRYRNPAERLAGRFAVKEAVMKMLGTGWSDGVTWTDIETTNNPAGKPEVKLSGELARVAQKMGIKTVSISISHTGNMAIASAVALVNK